MFEKLEMREAVNTLGLALAEASTLVAHHDAGRPAWCKDMQTNERGSRDLAAQALAQISYYRDQEPGRTFRWMGVVACSGQTIEALERLNEAKRVLKDLVRKVRGAERRVADSLDENELDETVRSLLAGTGKGRLNLLQATRKVPLLDRRPDRVGFTWQTKVRSLTRVTRTDVIEMIHRHGEDDPSRKADELSKLDAVPADRDFFVGRTVAPHVRANVVVPEALIKLPNGKREKRPLERRSIIASLPVFYLDDGSGLPDFNDLPDTPVDSPKERKEKVYVEKDPLIESPAVYVARPNPESRVPDRRGASTLAY